MIKKYLNIITTWKCKKALQAYLKRFKCNEVTARFIDKNKIRIFDRTNNYIAIYDTEKR